MAKVFDLVRTVTVAGVLAAGVAVAQSPSPGNQGGCYDTDANGKEVFIPNCELPAVPAKKPAPAAAPAEGKTPTASPAQQFPFPGEPTTTAVPAQQTPAQATPAQNGSAPASPAQAFPFPGEEKTPLVRPDGKVVPPPEQKPGGLKDAGSSGQSSSDDSSSSSSSSSSGMAGLPEDPDEKGPLADDPDAVLKKPRRKLPPVAKQTPSEREEEDLSVAEFYMADNNFRAAYLRASDAVSNAADDPNAHFALAEAARKLGKLDEAMTEYKKTLTLDPVAKQKKAAEKALKDMAGK